MISSPGQIAGPVIIYDDDHYAVGSALAEKLKARRP